jgi:hypothetical protein
MVLSTLGSRQIPKRGGVGQWLPSERGHGRNTCKKQNDFNCSCFILNTESRGIVAIIKEGSE